MKVTFDSGDINENGNWRGQPVCCLECREAEQVHYGHTPRYLVAELTCGACGDQFVEFAI